MTAAIRPSMLRTVRDIKGAAFAPAILTCLLLVGCQAAVAPTAGAGEPSHTASIGSNVDCGGPNETFLNWKKGGLLAIPEMAPNGLYGGQVGYSSANKGDYTFYVTSCDFDFNGIPVPPGYLYDWFGEVAGSGGNPTFSSTAAPGELFSGLWKRHITYSLFLYTSEGVLIESYEIGPVKQKRQELDFASPFQNGFVFPGRVELEIAHPASQK